MRFNRGRFLLGVIFFLGLGANAAPPPPHGRTVVTFPTTESATNPPGGEVASTDFDECCYGEKGKITQLEAALKDPELPSELQTQLTTALQVAKEGKGNPTIMKWFHDTSKGVFSEADDKGPPVLTREKLLTWTSSQPPPSPRPPTTGPVETLPPQSNPAPAPDTIPFTPPLTPTQPPVTLQPQPSVPPSSESAPKPPPKLPPKLPTDRPFFFPERGPLRVLRSWLMNPVQQRKNESENPEVKLGGFPKPTLEQPTAPAPAPVPAFNISQFNIPQLSITQPLAIPQRPNPVFPEVFKATGPPAPPDLFQNNQKKPTPNFLPNFLIERPAIAAAGPSSGPLANQALGKPVIAAPVLAQMAAQTPPAQTAAPGSAQTAPVATTEKAPSVVVISQMGPQQTAVSEKTPLEKTKLKSDSEALSPSLPGVSVIQNIQSTQQGASSPAPENKSLSELKALSATSKASGILPDFSGAFGKLKEILHAKKTGTAASVNQPVVNQSEKDPWAVERSPSSWELNVGGLEASAKGSNSIRFSSFQVGAGMAAALGMLMALVFWFFSTRQMKNRKPTWVEVIIDHPSLRKRPERKVKALYEPPK